MDISHKNAAGFALKNSNVAQLTNYLNEQLKEIDFNEGFYEADFIVNGNCSYLAALIEDLENGKTLWGQGNEQPIIIIKNIVLDKKDISVIGTYKDTLRFTFNGVTYLKFKAKDLIDELFLLDGKINIVAAGRSNINEWGGRKTPQILLDEIEIKKINEFDF